MNAGYFPGYQDPRYTHCVPGLHSMPATAHLPPQQPQQLNHVAFIPLLTQQPVHIPANAVGSEADQDRRARDSIIKDSLRMMRADIVGLAREVASMRAEIEALLSASSRSREVPGLDSTFDLTDLTMHSSDFASVDLDEDDEMPSAPRTHWPRSFRDTLHLPDHYLRTGRVGATAPGRRDGDGIEDAHDDQHSNDRGIDGSQNGGPSPSQLQIELQRHHDSFMASMHRLFHGLTHMRGVAERMRNEEGALATEDYAASSARLFLGLEAFIRDVCGAACDTHMICRALARERLVVPWEDNEITRDGEHLNLTANQHSTTGAVASGVLPREEEQDRDATPAAASAVAPAEAQEPAQQQNANTERPVPVPDSGASPEV